MRRFWQYQPIILAVWPYLILISLSLPDADAFSRFLTLYTLLTVPVYLCSFCRAGQLRRTGDTAALTKTALWVKLAHIPFYLGIFLLGGVLILVMAVPIFTIVSPLLVMLMAFCDYLLLLTSSWYAVSAVRLLWSRGRSPSSGPCAVPCACAALCWTSLPPGTCAAPCAPVRNDEKTVRFPIEREAHGLFCFSELHRYEIGRLH